MKITRKKPSLFLILYLSITAFFALLLVIGGFVLNRWLYAFEKSEAIHPAEDAFEKYFASEDFSKALEQADVTHTEFESVDDIQTALKKEAEGKDITFYSAQISEDSARYNVILTDPKADPNEAGVVPSQKIGTIHLSRNEEEEAFGFRGYELSKIEVFVPCKEKVTVTLPATSKLFVNGKEVGASFETGRNDHLYNAYLKSGVPGITLVTYTIDGLYLAPEIRCVDESGKEHVLAQNEDGSYASELCYDEDLKNSLGNYVLSGMKEYAKWMQADSDISDVAPYFDTSSQFYRNTAQNPWIYAWGEHDSFEFQNEVVENFFAFDEKNFACHISFDQVLHRYGRQDFIDRLDMIVFVRKIGNSYKIYDRIVQ